MYMIHVFTYVMLCIRYLLRPLLSAIVAMILSESSTVTGNYCIHIRVYIYIHITYIYIYTYVYIYVYIQSYVNIFMYLDSIRIFHRYN
jgi:hypothetical protein